ncbi:hypothetical protein Bca4012_084245 [Brassica carinata]
MEAPTPHLLLFLLFALSSLTTSTADDGAAMLALAKSFRPPPSDWSTTTSTDYCKWTGVKCTSGRVNSITLEDTSLSGGLAPEISTLSELKTLTLQRNKLSGKIPSFAKLSSLQEIYLDENLFDGVEPGAFSGLTSLQILSLSDNPNIAAWSFPSELADSTSLTTLSLDNTTISGVLPDVFDSFASLQNLRLSYNNITGVLPPSLAKSPVQNLWINNQESGLTGTIEVLSGMTSLSQAWLQKNQLTGPIPDLSKTNLFDLQLRDNQLTGVVSPSLLPLGSLKNITLDNNKFQGPLPLFPPEVEKVSAEHNYFCTTKAGENCDAQVMTLLAVAGGLGYPSTLAESWQGNDACSSWAYVTCDSSKKNVVTLNLAKHGFAGVISPAIANLTSLKNIYLNDNNLTGAVPKVLTFMPSLQLIDVSNNNLTGEIPVFPAQVKFNYKPGNVLIGTDVGDSTNGGGPGGGGSKAGVIIGVIVGVLVFLAIIGFVVYKFVMKKKYGKFGRTDPEKAGKLMVSDDKNGGAYGNGHGASNFNASKSPSSGDSSDRFLVEGGNVTIPIEVLRQVTNNFSEANILGRGGFGVVYAGELHDGTKTAIKRMECSSMATGRVTTKVDVYAFGVVLMEMLTGRKALDDSLPDEKCHLVTWFRRVLVNKENISKELDQTLEADEETLESIHRVAELAGHCTAREPQQRPDMGHAVNVLGPLVEKWKPTSQEEEESFGIDVNNMSLPQALQRWQQNEGTSTSMFGGDFSYSQTQSSIPPKPSGFHSTFDSTDGR